MYLSFPYLSHGQFADLPAMFGRESAEIFPERENWEVRNARIKASGKLT